MTDSPSWTGRPADAGSPVEMVRRAWHDFLWPSYVCTDYVGIMRQYGIGCYCAYRGAVAPGVEPEPWRVRLRKLPRRWRRRGAGR